MNILLIGSGGREHALAWKIARSPLLTKLYCAPGNAGIDQVAEPAGIDVADHDSVRGFCASHAISLVVIGPEAPLVAGLADDLMAAGINVFGPTKAAAQLEGSKGFTKDLCAENNIPTAAYGRFSSEKDALAYLESHRAPVVIKADGLAAGKGVIIAMSDDEARAAVADMFAGSFGRAGREVVIEEYLEGEEASFFALCDGTNAVALATAQDHKRAGEGDTGANTGGMGAYSPAPVMTHQLCDQVMGEIIQPTLEAMARRGAAFRGVLFAGLMICADGPKLIEYNVRFGDPECQVLMMRLADDIVPLLMACGNGTINDHLPRWLATPALSVVMAAEGYPGAVQKGSEIKGLEAAGWLKGVEIFHAGTALSGDGRLVASGGRVLNVTARARSLAEAQRRAYSAVDMIDWPEGFCRRDIGWRAIGRET